MATDYNQIAGEYVALKMQPWRALVEEHSLCHYAGDVSGRKLVDLACGQGFYTRRFRARGAREALGVDMSAEMIRLAREEEVREPLGIVYQMGDVMADGPREDFDLVVSAWLLTYAANLAVLDSMCRGIARYARSGARFVSFTTNNDVYHYPRIDYAKYGFTIHLDGPAREGATIIWRFPSQEGFCDIENYYLPNENYRAALERAGFRDVVFHPLLVADEGRREYSENYWNDLLENPPAMVVEATRV